MCGIFGDYSPGGADIRLIRRMAEVVAHRGPDGYGAHSFGTLAFGAGRLAIVDLTSGMQPLFNETGRIAVVYNGEIYNFRELRAELEAVGHKFTGRSDTEVIVHGYEEWGGEVFEKLRGMFAIGLWDDYDQRLLLARDRMGEKPLYYTIIGETLLFASEIKALFEHPELKRAVNQEALAYYLTLGYVPPPLTLFDGISKLAPGEVLLAQYGEVQTWPFAQPDMDTTGEQVPYKQAVNDVRSALANAVEMRLIGAVPLGAALSGGVDSAAVVALMQRRMDRPVQTFTIGYDIGSQDDVIFAELAARRLKTHHQTVVLRSDEQLAHWLPYMVYSLDEPLNAPEMIPALYTAALARHQQIPVLLSGDAGDELFAGDAYYREDHAQENAKGWTGTFARLARRQTGELSPAMTASERYLRWTRLLAPNRLPELLSDSAAMHLPRSFDGVLGPLLEAPQTEHFADRIAYARLRLWVAEDSNMRADKMSMAMAIESRAPFEDQAMVQLALGLPLEHKLRGGAKSILKDAVRDLVPNEILNRQERAGRPPVGHWLRTAFRPLVDAFLSPEQVEAAGCFRPEAIRAMVEAQRNGDDSDLRTLWGILVFHIWHALYIDQTLTLEGPYRAPDLVGAAV